MIRLALGRLLHVANSRPPFICRQEFYAMKDRLLNRFGQRLEGDDIQEIVKVCWNCNGSGHVLYFEETERCRRCQGTGVWDCRYHTLARYELGGFTFHRPIESRAVPRSIAVTIRGRIEHRDYGRASDEATLWLSLLFDRRLFWRLMRGSRSHGPTWRYPLVTLQKLVFTLAFHGSGIRGRRCHCGQWYRMWPWESKGWQVCRTCRAPKP